MFQQNSYVHHNSIAILSVLQLVPSTWGRPWESLGRLGLGSKGWVSPIGSHGIPGAMDPWVPRVPGAPLPWDPSVRFPSHGIQGWGILTEVARDVFAMLWEEFPKTLWLP